MTKRGFVAIGAVFGLLFPLEALAQETPIDEFDLGDSWVDGEGEGGWFTPWGPAFTRSSGSFRLDLSAGTSLESRQTDSESNAGKPAGRWSRSRDYYALATLQVPLDRILSSDSTQRSLRTVGNEPRLARRGPDAEETLVGSLPARKPEERSSGQGESRQTEQGGVREEEPPSESQVAEELPRPSAESDSLTPTLVLALAREIAERVGEPLDGAKRRLKSLIRRSRWSGLSPEMRVRGVLGFDRTTSTEETVGIYPGDTTVRGARDSLAEVRLTFRLDRLVLGDGEDSIERQHIDLEQERRKLVHQALEMFSKWRLAEARSADPSLPPDESLQARVDAEAAMIELHLMTGGWFQGRKSVLALARGLPDVRAAPD